MDEFGIFFLLGLDFQSLTWTRRLTPNFLGICRTSRVLLIPMKWPINIENKHTSFGKDQRLHQEGFSLVFFFFFSLLLSYEVGFHPNYV
jgi:hypothetical protein